MQATLANKQTDGGNYMGGINKYVTQKLLINIPVPYVRKLDGIASEESRTRSDCIREAVRMYITFKNKEALLAAREYINNEQTTNRTEMGIVSAVAGNGQAGD